MSQDVYDTATGKFLLIPQGTRLEGEYSSEVAYGQASILVAWQRLVFPDGKTMDIGAMPGSNSAGYAGFTDQVNNHYLRLFGTAILMSAITAGVALSQSSNQVAGTFGAPTTSSVLSATLGQQLGRVMTQMISKNLNISPTLEIRPGYIAYKTAELMLSNFKQICFNEERIPSLTCQTPNGITYSGLTSLNIIAELERLLKSRCSSTASLPEK